MKNTFEHSYKGSEWKKHKYVSKQNGRYKYPDDNKSPKKKDTDYLDAGSVEINKALNKVGSDSMKNWSGWEKLTLGNYLNIKRNAIRALTRPKK